MKEKLLLLTAVTLLAVGTLTACVDIQIATRAPQPTSTHAPWPTPILTATPVLPSSFNEAEVIRLIDQEYKVNEKCRLDLLKAEHVETPTIEFLPSELSADPAVYWVLEIAENASKTMRAFVACSDDPCHPKLYLQDMENGIVHEVNWSGRTPYRPISRILWIGDNQLAFQHLTSPHDAIIATVNTAEKRFQYYWLAGYPCE